MKTQQFAIIVVFVWIGFVCSISFMEAWLKFRAPLVTVPVGLSIGRLIFDALNKVEWVFALVIASSLILNKNKLPMNQLLFFCVPLALLAIQTFFFLPILKARVETILQGQQPLPSYVHFYYLAAEVAKVGCLLVFGVRLFGK